MQQLDLSETGLKLPLPVDYQPVTYDGLTYRLFPEKPTRAKLLQEIRVQQALSKAHVSPPFKGYMLSQCSVALFWELPQTREIGLLDEWQAWIIAEKIVKLLHIISGGSHGRISPDSLVINLQGQPFILFSGLGRGQVARVRVKQISVEQACLSPQQLACLKYGNYEDKVVDQKSDIFQAGLLLLLKSTPPTPIIKGMAIDGQQFQKCIKYFYKNYSKELSQLLFQCLKFDHSYRYSLTQLSNHIQRFRKQRVRTQSKPIQREKVSREKKRAQPRTQPRTHIPYRQSQICQPGYQLKHQQKPTARQQKNGKLQHLVQQVKEPLLFKQNNKELKQPNADLIKPKRQWKQVEKQLKEPKISPFTISPIPVIAPQTKQQNPFILQNESSLYIELNQTQKEEEFSFRSFLDTEQKKQCKLSLNHTQSFTVAPSEIKQTDSPPFTPRHNLTDFKPKTKHRAVYESLFNQLQQKLSQSKLSSQQDGSRSARPLAGKNQSISCYAEKQIHFIKDKEPKSSNFSRTDRVQTGNSRDSQLGKELVSASGGKQRLIAEIELYLASLQQLFQRHARTAEFHPLPQPPPFRDFTIKPGTFLQLSAEHEGCLYAVQQFTQVERFMGLLSAVSQEARRGIYIWSQQSYFAGEFVDGLQHGFGCLFKGAVKHLGYWRNGHREGPGVQWSGRNKKRGHWQDNCQDNPVTRQIVYPSGDSYKGQVLFDSKHGQGVYNSSKFRLQGQFQNDQFTQGKIYYTNGDFYQGTVKRNKRHGQGKYVYKDGDTYEGGWKEGLKDGVGSQNGKKGQWRDGHLVRYEY